MKHDFSERLNHPYFSGRIKKIKSNRYGRLVWDKHNKVKHEEPQVSTKGCVDPDFIENHKLATNIRPEEYT